MKKIVLFFFGFILFWNSSAQTNVFAQPDSCKQKLSTFVKNIELFNHLYPQEKVYLHFDNTGYFLGETIWFKAYVTTAMQGKPTVLSRVLYAELLNPEGEVVETKKLMIEAVGCNGSFLLPKGSLGAGFYEVRAYTRMMLNREEAVFSRVFPVFDAPENDGQYTPLKMTIPPRSQRHVSIRENAEKGKKVNVIFYPEGGNLVNGLISSVAFKATDESGKSIEVTGSVYNDQNEPVASFSTLHQGMGSFAFCPDGTKQTFKAIYQDKEYRFDLPQSLESGIILNVNSMQNGSVLVRLKKSPGYQPGPIGLTFTCRGSLLAFQTIDLSDQDEVLLKVPKADLPTGVNQITLFDAKGIILSERLVFINHGEKINISVLPGKPSTLPDNLSTLPDKPVYKPFEKIDLNFLSKDQNEQPVEASFSLSVRDAQNEFGSDYSGNIMTNLLLSSDLKGFVETPEYYFESDDAAHKTSLDLLMMTQGWRRYDWQQMAGVTPFAPKHKIEKGITIDGQILSLTRKKGQEGIKVNMWKYSEEGGKSQTGMCMTDQEGRFNFPPEDFFGKWKLTLETLKNEKKKEYYITLDRQFSPEPKAYSALEAQMDLKTKMDPETKMDLSTPVTAKEPQMERPDSTSKTKESKPKTLKGEHFLPEVKIETKTKLMDKGRITVLNMEKELEKTEDKGAGLLGNTFYDYFRQIDKNFTCDIGFSKDGEIIHINKRYKGKLVDVFLFTDGRELDSAFVEKLSVTQIKEATVCEASGANLFYHPNSKSTDVLIKIELNKGFQDKATPVGIRNTKLQGYTKPETFQCPDYRDGVLPDEKDYRRTLYWNPDVKTDAEGKASVSFYNNGTCKKLSISAEGLSCGGISELVQTNRAMP